MSESLKDNEFLIATLDIPEFLGRSMGYVRKMINKNVNNTLQDPALFCHIVIEAIKA